ncbi:MAG TPA: hypothetical protein VFW27_28230 [Actinoplanes sp.]|jgi:hypothetical protein|nr:hypothetical protein [Actinoplanes sp.]
MIRRQFTALAVAAAWPLLGAAVLTAATAVAAAATSVGHHLPHRD